MQYNSLIGSYYLNATHRSSSMAAQREVASMLLHPYKATASQRNDSGISA